MKEQLLTVWGKLTTSFDIYALLVALFYFISGAITCCLFLRFVFRKEIRRFRNLKRRVYLLRTGTATLEAEMEMFRKNGFFVVNNTVFDLSNDTNVLQALDDFAVFVLGYSDSYAHYQVIVDHAKSKGIPIVVLAKPGEIKEHMAIFQQYIYFEMCNTPARLLTTIFNLSLITPYEKE